MGNTALVPVRMKTEKIVTIDNKNSNFQVFAKWLYDKTMAKNGTPNGVVVSFEDIGHKILNLWSQDQAKKYKHEVNNIQIYSWITQARIYFEENLNCTIWCVRNEGYRASSKRETAVVYGKCISKTAAWAERSMRVGAITDRADLPYARQEIMKRAESGVKQLGGLRQRFADVLDEYTQNSPKQLENVKNGSTAKLISNR